MALMPPHQVLGRVDRLDLLAEQGAPISSQAWPGMWSKVVICMAMVLLVVPCPQDKPDQVQSQGGGPIFLKGACPWTPSSPIGSVCRLFGITPDTLRHYEKKGLLTPVTDPHSRYRYYTPDHLDRIEGILHARAMGIPWPSWARPWTRRARRPTRPLLAAQRQTLQERILALEEVLRQTDRRLATLRELQAPPRVARPRPLDG